MAEFGEAFECHGCGGRFAASGGFGIYGQYCLSCVSKIAELPERKRKAYEDGKVSKYDNIPTGQQDS